MTQIEKEWFHAVGRQEQCCTSLVDITFFDLALMTNLSQNAIKLPVLVSSGLSEAQSICGEFNEPLSVTQTCKYPLINRASPRPLDLLRAALEALRRSSV